MAETDDQRVEARLGTIRGGLAASTDKIRELEARRLEFERRMRPAPTIRFSSLLRGKKKGGEEEELSVKDSKLQSLPRKGPRPSPLHPKVRSDLGREEVDGDVVLKG